MSSVRSIMSATIEAEMEADQMAFDMFVNTKSMRSRGGGRSRATSASTRSTESWQCPAEVLPTAAKQQTPSVAQVEHVNSEVPLQSALTPVDGTNRSMGKVVSFNPDVSTD